MNEILELAMTSSDETNHDSVSLPKIGKEIAPPRLRVWMMNDNAYSSFLTNLVGSRNILLGIRHRVYDEKKNRPSMVITDKRLSTVLYAELFFDEEHYEAVCEIDSDNLNDAFSLCGNNPRFAESWATQFECRSFSVGDIVEQITDEGSRFFVCDAIGWKEIFHAKISFQGQLPTIGVK